MGNLLLDERGTCGAMDRPQDRVDRVNALDDIILQDTRCASFQNIVLSGFDLFFCWIAGCDCVCT